MKRPRDMKNRQMLLFGLMLSAICGHAIAAPIFDENGFTRLLDYHRKWQHVDITNQEAVTATVLAEIQKNVNGTQVVVQCTSLFSVMVEKKADAELWRPIGLLRISKPVREEYQDDQRFFNDTIDYYASSWILKHPTKHYFYCPAAPAMKGTNGMWRAETENAVRAGHGLSVLVDPMGELSEIREVFTED